MQIQHLRNYLESAKNIKQQFDENEANLIDLYQQTKAIKKEIISQLSAEKIYEGISSFQADMDTLTGQLVAVLEFGSVHLQKCYKDFPNNPILWFLHDRTWHTNLKTISGLLYANQYSASTWYGTLEIKKEFIGLIKAEIDHFAQVAFAKMPLIKMELSRSAAKLFGEIKIDLRAKIAEQGIELVEAPKVSMFSTAPAHNSRPNIYQLMAAFHQYQIQGITNQQRDSEEASDEFYHN